jgi:hypothetical protein
MQGIIVRIDPSDLCGTLYVEFENSGYDRWFKLSEVVKIEEE